MENETITTRNYYELDNTLAVSDYIKSYVSDKAYSNYIESFFKVWLEKLGIKRDDYVYISVDNEPIDQHRKIFEVVSLYEGTQIKVRYTIGIDISSSFLTNLELNTQKNLYIKSIKIFKELKKLKENIISN